MTTEQSSNSLTEYLIESKFDPDDPEATKEYWLNMQAEVGIITQFLGNFDAINTVLVAVTDQQLERIKLIKSVGVVRLNRTHKV